MDKERNLKDNKRIAEDYLMRLKEVGIPVEEAYIFGSRVKGTNHIWSDLDTCIVSPTFGVDPIAERMVLIMVGRKVNDIIEPHPFSPSEFNDKFNPFAKEIKRTGIKIG